MWLMSLTKSFRLFPGGSCVPIVYATEQSLSRSSMARADYWYIADHLIKTFGQAGVISPWAELSGQASHILKQRIVNLPKKLA